MQPPMIGNWLATVVAAKPYSIHGDNYVELHVAREEGDTVLRAPAHAFTTPPAVGQSVEITFLMGQVTAVVVLD